MIIKEFIKLLPTVKSCVAEPLRQDHEIQELETLINSILLVQPLWRLSVLHKCRFGAVTTSLAGKETEQQCVTPPPFSLCNFYTEL